LRSRRVFCATVAVLAVASAALVGACSSGACSEMLTCDGGPSSEGGQDGTLDALAEVGSDVETDGTVEAAGEAATDALDGSDATDGSTDAGDSTTDATDGPTDAGCAAPFTCAPAVPTGFHGPVAFAEEAADSGNAPAPPACTPPYTVQVASGFNDPIASPASCTCTCGSLKGGCSTVTIETFSDNICQNECNAVLAGACTASGCGGIAQSAIVSVPRPSGGSCAEAVQKSVPAWNPTANWAVTGRACASSSALPEGGCTGAEVCAPSSPFGSSLCVWESGNVACPTPYPNQHLVYASGSDSRTCADNCTCASPTGVSCSVVATVASKSSCSGGSVLVADAGSCAHFGSVMASFVSASVTPSGGSCTPGGSTAPSGTVTPTEPTTVCCEN